MTTVKGHGKTIRIDRFTEDPDGSPQVYLLSHAHSDHFVGLTDKFSGQEIYCTEGTREILMNWRTQEQRALLEEKCLEHIEGKFSTLGQSRTVRLAPQPKPFNEAQFDDVLSSSQSIGKNSDKKVEKLMKPSVSKTECTSKIPPVFVRSVPFALTNSN